MALPGLCLGLALLSVPTRTAILTEIACPGYGLSVFFTPPKDCVPTKHKMEETCEYVSSYGLIRSCDVFPPNPQSSCADIDLDTYLSTDNLTRENARIYVCNSAIRNFLYYVVPFLQNHFVLVSGNSDNDMPFSVLSQEEFHRLVRNPLLQHWFCQNFVGDLHPKVSPMPIGLDYHTLKNHIGIGHPWGAGAMPAAQEQDLKAIAAAAPYSVINMDGPAAPPSQERILKCYSNWHHAAFGINQRGDRQEVLQKVPHSLIHFDEAFRDRNSCWRTQSFFRFVLSPRGGGTDCHRTWEALILGCIPIVKSSPLDPLFEDLPVLIVADWSEVTEERLLRCSQEFEGRQFNMEKVKLGWWLNQTC